MQRLPVKIACLLETRRANQKNNQHYQSKYDPLSGIFVPPQKKTQPDTNTELVTLINVNNVYKILLFIFARKQHSAKISTWGNPTANFTPLFRFIIQTNLVFGHISSDIGFIRV